PISGYVSYRYVKPSNLLRQYEQQKLLHILASEVWQSNVYLPERELQRVKVAQTAHPQFPALNTQTVTATVARISPV
ncbi:HlyD family secretion protein, partial [Micrococcus sp. SIMBA_144]